MTPDQLKQSIAEIESAAGSARGKVAEAGKNFLPAPQAGLLAAETNDLMAAVGDEVAALPPGLLAAMCELAMAAKLLREADERWLRIEHLQGESVHVATARFNAALATFRTALEAK